jgi:hypothetical protein
VADEMVGHFAEMVSGDNSALELVEGVAVHLLDRLDEVIEADGIVHLSRFHHEATLG